MIHHREWDTMFFFYEKRQKSVNAQYQASFRPLRFIIYIAVGHLTWRHLSNVRLAYQSIHLVSLCHNIIKRRVASVPNNMSYFNQRRLFWFVPVECFQQTFTAVSVIFDRHVNMIWHHETTAAEFCSKHYMCYVRVKCMQIIITCIVYYTFKYIGWIGWQKIETGGEIRCVINI